MPAILTCNAIKLSRKIVKQKVDLCKKYVFLSFYENDFAGKLNYLFLPPLENQGSAGEVDEWLKSVVC